MSGWEYSTDGKCEKMPSTRLLNLKIKSLPCFEQEGMIWIWPGNDPPTATIPSLEPPPGFQIHAEVCIAMTFISFDYHECLLLFFICQKYYHEYKKQVNYAYVIL